MKKYISECKQAVRRFDKKNGTAVHVVQNDHQIGRMPGSSPPTYKKIQVHASEYSMSVYFLFILPSHSEYMIIFSFVDKIAQGVAVAFQT